MCIVIKDIVKIKKILMDNKVSMYYGFVVGN